MINTKKAFYWNDNCNNLPPQIKKQIYLIGWYICNPDEIINLIKEYGGTGTIQWRDGNNRLHTKTV